MHETKITIRCRDDGPYVVEGTARIIDADGNEFVNDSTKSKIALCRCGSSGNRPFCDGSHRDKGFEAADRAIEC